MSNASTAVVAAPHATAPLHAVTTGPDAGASEENRWLLGFGLPCLVASLLRRRGDRRRQRVADGLRDLVAARRDHLGDVARDQL